MSIDILAITQAIIARRVIGMLISKLSNEFQAHSKLVSNQYQKEYRIRFEAALNTIEELNDYSNTEFQKMQAAIALGDLRKTAIFFRTRYKQYLPTCRLTEKMAFAGRYGMNNNLTQPQDRHAYYLTHWYKKATPVFGLAKLAVLSAFNHAILSFICQENRAASKQLDHTDKLSQTILNDLSNELILLKRTIDDYYYDGPLAIPTQPSTLLIYTVPLAKSLYWKLANKNQKALNKAQIQFNHGLHDIQRIPEATDAIRQKIKK